MAQKTTKKKLALVDSIPSIPTMYAKISSLIQDPNCSVEEIADLIETDPVTAARALKIANSARYGLRVEVSSIRHAVMVLGVRTIENVVLETTLMATFDHLRDRFDTEEFWRHAVRVAAATRNLAKLGGQDSGLDPETCYSSGLLHDIGNIAIASADSERYGSLLDRCAGDEEQLCAAERQCYGMDHAEYGGLVLHSWNLPRMIVKAVTRHHQIEEGCNAEALARMVRMHDRMDHALTKDKPEAASRARDMHLMLMLNIPPDTFTRYLDELTKMQDVEVFV